MVTRDNYLDSHRNLLTRSYKRDGLGRIQSVIESQSGKTSRTTSDSNGRLTDVAINGIAASHYVYDGNGNRVFATIGGTPVATTYDQRDRMLTTGAVMYAYGSSGDLASKTIGGQSTLYSYDAAGNLRGILQPNGSSLTYVVDGRGRRVGKKLNGTLVLGLLYGDDLRPIAQTDGLGSVVKRFVYGTGRNVPELMITSSGVFRILTDHVGSVRRVIDTSSGAAVAEMDYDEFGQATVDTSPGFVPFGFAGGLYDPDTSLLRFGSRDYDPATGRWSTADRANFASGDVNLYAYVGNDPINRVDAWGTSWWDTVKKIAAAALDGIAGVDATPYREAYPECHIVPPSQIEACCRLATGYTGEGEEEGKELTCQDLDGMNGDDAKKAARYAYCITESTIAQEKDATRSWFDAAPPPLPPRRGRPLLFL